MIGEDIERYIALHQTLGFKFRQQASLLRCFVRYATDRGELVLRAQTAVAWATEAPAPGSRRGRLQAVRRFARAQSLEDPACEMPPEITFGPVGPRRRPHIFTPAEISRLLHAAGDLAPRGSLRPITYMTLFALLAATGLRISEALALRLEDLTPAGLRILETKFRKSRLVPLHPTVHRGLQRYLRERRKLAGAAETLFVSSGGRPLPYSTVVTTYLALARRIGRRPPPESPGPHIHDLRHTFAVRSLEQCPAGRDAARRHMLALSTYLGHAHLADTYWYLQATAELLAPIAAAAEALAEGGA